MQFKYELGDKIKDLVTSFIGIVVCRSQWLNNCNTYGVQSQSLKDNTPQEKVWFDEPQLVLVEKNCIKSVRDTGGAPHVVESPNR